MPLYLRAKHATPGHISVVPEVTYMSRMKALEGCCVSSNSPSSVGDRYKGVARRNGRENVSQMRGYLFAPLQGPGKL